MCLRDDLLAELKAFDRIAWSRQRFALHKFPYELVNGYTHPDAIDALWCIEEFYKSERGGEEFSTDYCDGVYDESMHELLKI